jgi:uncharacterized protein
MSWNRLLAIVADTMTFGAQACIPVARNLEEKLWRVRSCILRPVPRDRAKTEQFFADLFGWHKQGSGPASTIETGGQQSISGHITAFGHQPQHYTISGEAAALGGKTVVPPVKIPMGTFA